MRRAFLLFCIAFFVCCTTSCIREDRARGFAVSGSSTLAPLMEIMLDKYVQAGFEGTVSLDSIGSGAGIRRYLHNECDVVSASRAMTSEESSKAADLGKKTIGIVVAMDAVAVCTGGGVSGNVSSQELPTLLTADTWGDVRLEWPLEPIEKYYPGQDSGTFDFIVSTLFGGDNSPILSASGLQLSEDDHVLVQGLLGDPWALGFFGYSYYMDRKDTLTLLSIDGFLPEDGSDYPLSRPLYLYFNTADEKTSDVVADFARFVLESVASGDKPPGFLPPSKRIIEEGRRVLSSLEEDLVTP